MNSKTISKKLPKKLSEKLLIAIDGPAGVGKSTVARLIAQKLNIIHLDSGALYRSLTYLGLNKSIPPKFIPKYLKNNSSIFQFSYKNNAQQIFIKGESAEQKIRDISITQTIKMFAESPECRSWVNSLMQKISKTYSLVVDGRDIGTAVFPEADFKFYLDASIEIRAQRRAIEKNISLDGSEFEFLKKEIQTRDTNDKNRVLAPLAKAKDAVYLDSSEMEQEQVVKFFLDKIQNPKLLH